MLRINQIKMHIPHTKEQLSNKICSLLKCKPEEIESISYVRRSVDARKKPELFYIYTVDVKVKNEGKIYKGASRGRDRLSDITIVKKISYPYPQKQENQAEHIVVVGAGPAGLFCSYFLAMAGKKVTLLERGEDVDKRICTVSTLFQKGELNPSSNVQFGEGGAGTFSDGKLNTLVKDKSGRNTAVLETFVRFGAKESILYDAKPHIGTDSLSKIVKNMREEIIRLGGEVRFLTQMKELVIKQNKVEGVVVNEGEEIACDRVVLAIGHSARDTFSYLEGLGLNMEAKAFAVGFRVQHTQKMIDTSQYGGENKELGAAPYKLTAKAKNERGVYSFCMCPGGYVVNASSEPNRLAVNGMSYSDRASGYANSAVIVAVTPEDFEKKGALGGVYFQKELEERAYLAAKGKIPVERYGDFYESITGKIKTMSTSFDEALKDMEPCCKGAYAYTSLSNIFPDSVNEAFVDGMEAFERQIHGFASKNTLLMGVESRTSSPVRIVRDEFLQSNIHGIYPCGEGAGYAGGITSAAMDGIRVAEEIIKCKNEEIIKGTNEKIIKGKND